MYVPLWKPGRSNGRYPKSRSYSNNGNGKALVCYLRTVLCIRKLILPSSVPQCILPSQGGVEKFITVENHIDDKTCKSDSETATLDLDLKRPFIKPMNYVVI